MTNKQILKEAIEKAFRNGWDEKINYQRLSWTIAHDYRFMDYCYWYSIIFSHSFAKAFWGEKIIGTIGPPLWSYCLQQMVLEEYPLKYLKGFLS